MLGAVLSLLLTSATNGAASQQVLGAEAACRLIKGDRIPGGTTYVIQGVYFSDWHHGSNIELPNCDDAIFPILADDVSAKVQSYHRAFQVKCGGVLMGDRIVGVFTGHFERKKAMLYSFTKPLPVDFFVVTDVATKDLDAGSISCPG